MTHMEQNRKKSWKKQKEGAKNYVDLHQYQITEDVALETNCSSLYKGVCAESASNSLFAAPIVGLLIPRCLFFSGLPVTICSFTMNPY